MKISPVDLPCVLFVTSNNANYLEMISVANFLKKNAMATALFFCESNHSIVITGDNYEYIRVSDFRKWLEKKVVKIFFRIFLIKRKNELEQKTLSYLLSMRLKCCLRILKDKKPVSIVLRGDRHVGQGWEPAFIRAGTLLGIPTVVLTYSYTSYAETLLLRRRNKQELNADNYPQTKDSFPAQWIYDHVSGKNILYKSASIIAALNENDMLPENPWIMGGGNSTLITAAGKSMKDRFVGGGCKAGKVVVTGLAAHDRLYEKNKDRKELKEIIYKKYNLTFQKKLVVVSPIQLFEEKICDLEEAKNEIGDLLRMCNLFESNVIISLHPRIEKELYNDVFEKYDIPIAEERLFDIIPAADIFSAPYSSTVDWAILCGVPVVIFDFYNFNYSKYDGFAGITIVKDKREYVSEVNYIISNDNILQKQRDYQVLSSINASPFDGRCLTRIADVLLTPEQYMNKIDPVKDNTA